MDNTTADAPDQGAGSDVTSRRRLLTAGISGAALAVLASRPAAAATEESTTTTAPPKRPTDADMELLVFAQSAELAALELYRTALEGSDSFDDLARSTLGAIRQHHDAYAEVLAGLLGGRSVTSGNESIVASLSADFSGTDSAAIALAAHGLEKTLVATHSDLLGRIDGTDASTLLASIVTVEARHIPVLATLAGLDPASDTDAFVGPNDATPLSPA